MPDDLVQIINENRAFPAIDIATIPADPLGLQSDCKLSSYLHLDTALAQIAGADASGLAGLLNADPATHRYTVLTSETDRTLYAVIAAVRNDIGARDQVVPLFGPRMSPASITSAAEIGADRMLVFSLKTALTLSAAPHVRFGFHWLREVTAGSIQGQLGDDIDSGIQASVQASLSDNFLAAVSLDEQGWMRLRIIKHAGSSLDLGSTLKVQAQAQTPLPQDPGSLIQAILRAGAGLPVEAAPGTYETATQLATSAYQKLYPALEKKYAATLSWSYHNAANGTVLIDCSFDFTAEGLAAYAAAVAGDFSGVLGAAPGPHVRLRSAALTEALDGQCSIELHLPFFDNRQWTTRWDALANAQIEAGEDGRLITYTVNASDRAGQLNGYQSTLALAASLLCPQNTSSFQITYTDTRSGDAVRLARSLASLAVAYGFPPETLQWLEAARVAGGKMQSALTLSVPGTLVNAWFRAPAEQDPNFFDVYSKVSVTIQQLMRRWIPFIYFGNLDNYENLLAAYSLILYQSTRPFPGKPRCDFSYDLVTPDYPGVAAETALRPFASALDRVQQLLSQAKRSKLLLSYAPWHADEYLAKVVGQPRLINALLTGDGFFIDRLVNLGLEARKLAGDLASDPVKATRELVDFAADFTALFHRRLRRLYGEQDFIAFGSLLFIEATRALGAVLDGDAAISATLRVSAGANQQTFVNSAWRPN